MYRISINKRKYSPTPIVKVTVGADGREQEEIIMISTEKKAKGDIMSETIVVLLNNAEESTLGRDKREDFFSKKHVKGEAPTGTAEALAFAFQHEMKSDKKPDFIYYKEKKL